MSEYRRFIAYFYEYINGRKQKNTGFAKVELRNNMWRILFHLTIDTVPEEPIQVYGFVRSKGYLMGFRLGTMQTGRELGEEWAYQADTFIGYEKYRFADLSGIWIQSGDERDFITVWDDEGVETQKFITEIPEVCETRNNDSKNNDFSAENRIQIKDNLTEIQQEELEIEDFAENLKKLTETDNAEEIISVYPEQIKAAEVKLDEKMEQKSEQKKETSEIESSLSGTIIEEIFEKRKKYHPFMDDEIRNCVQIMPCDLVRLQQERWKVGRSSFLQHGFYQYRHLLLGKTADGSYILGVPGENNPQERCMAELFGYDRFKCSHTYACGKKTGYWYRRLSL